MQKMKIGRFFSGVRMDVLRCLVIAVLMSQVVIPSTANGQLSFTGVSLAGADFGEGNLPGNYGQHYIYPNNGEVDYFMSKGMNTFRLPFRWERLQRSTNADFNTAEFNRFDNFISYATGQGANVVLDPHNYARYYGNLIGSSSVTHAHFADFWSRLANEYKDNERVIFQLVNEPNTMPTEQWLTSANTAIQAIRDTGAKNLILVPGNAWTGAHSWTQNWYGTPNATVMSGVVDPGNNFAFDLHQYLDGDSSGRTDEIVNQNIGQQRLVAVTNWLKQNNYRGFLGEFAAANSTIGNGGNRIGDEAINNMLDYVEANSDVWMGWSWWAAGPWWGNYLFSLEPNGNQDAAAMSVLQPRFTSEDGAPLMGDYNADGIVDASDYTVWRNALGTNTLLPGDTSPGLVSQVDYDVWVNNFGATDDAPFAAVPEPVSAHLALLAFAGFYSIQRRVQKRGVS